MSEIENAAAATSPAVEVKGPTKSSIAKAIFDTDYGVKSRKEIIARFVAEADMSTTGAATYYQTFRNEDMVAKGLKEAKVKVPKAPKVKAEVAVETVVAATAEVPVGEVAAEAVEASAG